jgi:hypothetical protein
MIKAKFGDSVRSKTDVSMRNEALCKILCHNLCCLIQSFFELGVDPEFWGRKPAVTMKAPSPVAIEAGAGEEWAWV